MNKKIIFLVTLFFLNIYLLSAQQQTWEPVVKLTEPNRATNDYFGYSVAIDGDYAIAGAFRNSEAANRAGAAYIYKKQDGSWVFQQNLIPSGGRYAYDHFGQTVAISGDYAIVSSQDEETGGSLGAVYVFKLVGEEWIEQQKLVAPVRSNENFGWSYQGTPATTIATDGDYIVIGAIGDTGNEDDTAETSPSGSGAVYIFKRNGETWEQQQKIVAFDRAVNNRFGNSVGISGDRIVVGAFGNGSDENGEEESVLYQPFPEFNPNYWVTGNPRAGAGAAYIFKQENDNWSLEQKIVASDRTGSDQFGRDVSINGNYVVAGALANDTDADADPDSYLNNAGAAYVYYFNGENWVEQQKLTAADRGITDNFGARLDIDGDRIVVGAYQDGENEDGEETVGSAGSAYVFKRNGTEWTQEKKLVSWHRHLTNSPYVYFSIGIAIDGNTIIVGSNDALNANGDEESYLNNAGAAYIFSLTCPEIEAPVVESVDAVCSGSSVTLTATASEGNTVNWYGSEDAAEILHTGSEYTIETLTETTTYWVEAVTDEGCTSERIPVTATANPLPELTVITPTVETCEGTTAALEATAAEGHQVVWYDSEEATQWIATGEEFTVEDLATGTYTYWVQAYDPVTHCVSERTEVVVTILPLPELTVITPTVETCEGSTAALEAAAAEGHLVVWYDSEEATQWIATGEEFTIEDLAAGTYTYWVQAYNPETHCVSERTEIVVTVLPLPGLEAETAYEICSGSEAYLYAYSEGNVVFWHANEDDEEYLYHGNLFVTPELTETTTYWVEAYNIITGCASERIEVTVTVNPVPDAPIAVSYQTVEEGTTLADLDVEADGALTWYANEALTVVLPETTLVEENTIYYVTQTIAGCESEAAEISVEFLGLTDINGNSFTVYPNPTAGIVKIRSKAAVTIIEVFSISGQLVTSVKAANEVNISGYPGGTYVLRITLENGEVVTKKVIKK